MQEGLFCLQEPEARYDLTACGNCGLCYPRGRRSPVQFNDAHRYRFLNGYEAILNCSVVGDAPCFWSGFIISVFVQCPHSLIDLSYTEYRLCPPMSLWSSGIYRCDRSKLA